MTALPSLLQGFFTERLIGQRDASAHTIAAYRDCFRLLLGFVHDRTGKAPSKLLLEDRNGETISAEARRRFVCDRVVRRQLETAIDTLARYHQANAA